MAAEARERADADAEEKAAREKAVADERARAEGAEQANAAAIAKETSDRAEAVKAEADARTAADTALGERVDTEIADRKAAVTAEETARKSADAALDGRVTAVEGKIPAQASAENQLADKAFVNSSISTATATFRGTFESLEALKAAEADKNDYAFWVHKDEDGNTCYDKYTYTGTEWKFEYRQNNSSFTAAQWAAINSGVTADVVKALQDADKANAKAIADEKAERIAAVAAEQAAREQADTANANAIATEATERKAADAALQAAIDALPPAAIKLTYDLDALALFGATMADVAAALEKGAEVSVAVQNRDAELSSPTSVLRVVSYSYTAPVGPLLLHAVSPRYTTAADVQDNFNSVVFRWTDGGNVSLYRFTPQAPLVSGENIKTVNGESLLGSGDLAVSGGLSTIKAGEGKFAEIFNYFDGSISEAPGNYSHAEGHSTAARGDYSHAEGFGTSANGTHSHAEGRNAAARGDYSHAEGLQTIAIGSSSHAEGIYNVGYPAGIHEVGIGSAKQGMIYRKNAHTITNDGKHYIINIGGYQGTETNLTGVKDLATVISELGAAGGGGGPFALTLTLGTGDKWAMDCTFEELAAAVDAKRGVIFTMSGGSYDGNAFTATLLLHSSAGGVVVMQGYVNKAFIYVMVTNGSTGLTVDVSEVNLVDIDTAIPDYPDNVHVPGTKAIKDYIDNAISKLRGVVTEKTA